MLSRGRLLLWLLQPLSGNLLPELNVRLLLGKLLASLSKLSLHCCKSVLVDDRLSRLSRLLNRLLNRLIDRRVTPDRSRRRG